MAETKVRTVRVEDDLWNLVTVVAKRRQTTASQIIKAALFEYAELYATDEDRHKAAEQ